MARGMGDPQDVWAYRSTRLTRTDSGAFLFQQYGDIKPRRSKLERHYRVVLGGSAGYSRRHREDGADIEA